MSASGFRRRGALLRGEMSFMRWVRLVILLALVALVVMMMWPVEPLGQTGNEADAGEYFDKALYLEQAIRRPQPVRVVINESEINGYLAALMKHAESQGADVPRTRLVPRGVNVAFTEEHFVVHILAGWGPARLSYELTGRPAERSSSGFRIHVDQLRVGHVPMPVGIRDWLAKRMLPVFDQMERERFILDRVDGFETRERRMRLTTP